LIRPGQGLELAFGACATVQEGTTACASARTGWSNVVEDDVITIERVDRILET
jgi:hypothetical protein